MQIDRTITSTAIDRSWQHDAEVIGLVSLAHGTSHFFHLLLPPLYPWLIKDFGLSYTRAGLLMTVFFAVSGIGQALAGFVVDRLGARPVLLFGVGTLALSGLLLGLAASYWTLIAVAAVAGLGNSVFHPTDLALLNRHVSTSRLGHAFSSHGLVGNLGWAAGAACMGWAAATVGWHAAGFGAGALAFLVWLTLLLRPESLRGEDRGQRDGRRSPPDGGRGLSFLRSSAIWMCFVFFFLSTGAFSVLQNFSGALLGQVYGLAPASAAGALGAFLLGGAAGTVAGGFALARFRDSDATIALALGLSALLSAWLALGAVPRWSLIACLALMGFGIGTSGPSRDLLVRRAASRFGSASYGRVYGFVYSGLDAEMALTPLAFGRLLDAGYFRAALLGVALLQVAALSCALAARK